jgi:hypothetical protein
MFLNCINETVQRAACFAGAEEPVHLEALFCPLVSRH